MTGRDVARRWEHGRRRLRERLSRHLPQVLITHPFEVVALVIAALMGIPVLLGLVESAALVALVGAVPLYAWATTLSIGSIVSAIGIKRSRPAVLASGLSMIGGSFLVYVLALVAVLGLGGALGAAAYLLLGIISIVRALHYRRILDIQEGATRLSRGDTT